MARSLLPRMAPLAYEDSPFPIGEGQTISQPAVAALMTKPLVEQLREGGRMRIPVGHEGSTRMLTMVRKQGGKMVTEQLIRATCIEGRVTSLNHHTFSYGKREHPGTSPIGSSKLASWWTAYSPDPG